MEAPVIFSAEWWQQPLGSWMAWNRVTIAFFLYVFGSILAMGVWEYFSPGGSPRRGIFRLETTRGDRLFMTHLGTASSFWRGWRSWERPYGELSGCRWSGPSSYSAGREALRRSLIGT